MEGICRHVLTFIMEYNPETLMSWLHFLLPNMNDTFCHNNQDSNVPLRDL